MAMYIVPNIYISNGVTYIGDRMKKQIRGAQVESKSDDSRDITYG